MKGALIDSLLTVLSAAVIVLIVVYGYQAVRAVTDRILYDDQGAEEESSRLEILESLKSDEEVSEEEEERRLESLHSPEGASMSEEEQIRLLESLQQP
jgi:uncharacterized membrane protein